MVPNNFLLQEMIVLGTLYTRSGTLLAMSSLFQPLTEEFISEDEGDVVIEAFVKSLWCL